jgi:hypothetical protein
MLGEHVIQEEQTKSEYLRKLIVGELEGVKKNTSRK